MVLSASHNKVEAIGIFCHKVLAANRNTEVSTLALGFLLSQMGYLRQTDANRADIIVRICHTRNTQTQLRTTDMKDYLDLYFSEFLIIISIINLVLLGYLVFYLKKHKKLHIPHKEQPHKEQPTPFTLHKKEVEKRVEEKVEREIEREETDNNFLPNKKKENYVELLRPRIAKWVESKAYMREQFTIEELAAKLYTNKTYLSSFIREEYSMNFSGWIAHLRIEEAKRMMRENPDQKLIDVAFNVGFSSLAYFSSVFSKIEGVSPSVWLKKAN